MRVTLKTFSTTNAFYVEAVDENGEVYLGSFAIEPEFPVAEDAFGSEIVIELMELDDAEYDDEEDYGNVDYDDVEIEFDPQLPGYVVVVFVSIVAGKKYCRGCALYGPGGFLGPYPTTGNAWEAAAAHKESADAAFGK